MDVHVQSFPRTMVGTAPELHGSNALHGRVAAQNGQAASPSTLPPLKAMIFDKDGTLISFDATWSAWADNFIDRIGMRCGGDKARQAGRWKLVCARQILSFGSLAEHQHTSADENVCL